MVVDLQELSTEAFQQFYPKVDRFLTSLKQERTQRSYTLALRWIAVEARARGVTHVRDLTREQVKSIFDNWKMAAVSQSALALRSVALRQLCYWYAEEGILYSSPIPQAMAVMPNRTPLIADPEDFKKILRAVDLSTLKGKRDYAIFLTIYYACARSGEVSDLRLRDYRRVGKEKVLEMRERMVPVHNKLQAALDSYLKACGLTDQNAPLFRSFAKADQPLSAAIDSTSIYRLVTKYLPNTNVNVDMIRNLAIQRYVKTFGIEKARALVGHAHLKTTLQFMEKEEGVTARSQIDVNKLKAVG